MKKLFLILFYLVSVIASLFFSYENPEKIEKIKDYFKKNKNIKVEKVDGDNLIFYANAFNVNVKKIIDLKEKTAFLT